ncbi:MAG: primosomal protein N' [Thermoanaerobaculia bacterium]
MPHGLSDYVEVAVPMGVHGTFTYSVPDALRDEVRLGARVEVPWGSKRTTGYVVGFLDQPAIDVRRIRPLRDVLDDDEPALLPDILELCRWAAEYYIAPIGEMLRVALPANMSSTARKIVSLTRQPAPALLETLSDRERAVVELLVSRKKLEVRKIVESVRGARGTLARLEQAGLVVIAEDLHDSAGVRYDRHALLMEATEELTPKQTEIVSFIRDAGGEVPLKALENAGLSRSAAMTLARRGVIAFQDKPRRHTLDAFLSRLGPATVGDLVHTGEQRAAIAAIRKSLGRFGAFLLQGVTGSGKTEVYIELMREVVSAGSQAIFLVPEISLTPVLAARLKERFGERIAILHSGLSASERYDQWWRARRGAVDVAIGPRSALFTPFQQLGLVIVDEEGDSAYKQEETPRYNARDLAVVRARALGIPVVLGSATPSLESRENAARGKYELIRLTRRVEERQLPNVEIIDIRHEKGEKEDRGLIIFSQRMREELGRVFERGEQAIILINRRGYAPFLLCRECDNDFRCRDCSVSLTVHRRQGLLICHYCGYRRAIPAKCPLCNGEVLQPIGFGTEKVEERFRSWFPEVAVDVVDRDSVRRKGELVRIFDGFRRRKTQALIGTQIISKGHDFPGVTLTCVINADSILGFPDFRSAEKTFYLLTQVAGRSGRGQYPGSVLIQTAFPQHYAIQHAIHHDYEAFFAEEMEFRSRFRYPPASSMIAILFRGEDEAKVEAAAREGGESLEREGKGIGDLRIQGPAPAPLARIKGVWRYQILLRSAQRAALRRAVARTMTDRKFSGVDVVIDVDPINIL